VPIRSDRSGRGRDTDLGESVETAIP